MDIDTLKSLDPMIWILIAAAGSICAFILFNKAIKKLLKLVLIGGIILLAIYFLIQSGVIELPEIGKVK